MYLPDVQSDFPASTGPTEKHRLSNLLSPIIEVV